MAKTDDIIRKLKEENVELKSQLEESRETLQAIQSGEVDALVVSGKTGDQIYTLKDAEHPYRVMVETMNEGAATLAPDGSVFYCNNQLASLLKVPLSRIMAVPLTNFIVPDYLPAFQSILKRAFQSTGRAEIEFRDSSGDTIPVLVSARALSDETRQMVSLVVTDLSEHKHTEQVIASERFARTMMEQAADVIVVCDFEGNIIRASEKAHNLIGIDLEGWKFDQVFKQFYPVSSAGKPLSPESLSQPVNLSALCRDEIPSESEIALITDGRSQKSFMLNFSTLSEEEDILGYSIALTDITERKKAEEVLKRYTAELEAANKELEAFNYSVSHDLRTPLRALESFSDLLIENYKDKLDEAGKGYLNRIRKASQHMSQITEDILKLSRITQAEMQREEVNLSAVAAFIAHELKATQPERQSDLIIAPNIIVNCDRSLLQILMQNLLENSWKYSSKCAISRIEIGVDRQDGKTVYFIKDNGVGFDMQYKDKLFQPFQRLHSSQDYPGTGIGLAIVQRVINRHDGKIWAESEVGKGTTFYFTLT